MSGRPFGSNHFDIVPTIDVVQIILKLLSDSDDEVIQVLSTGRWLLPKSLAIDKYMVKVGLSCRMTSWLISNFPR